MKRVSLKVLLASCLLLFLASCHRSGKDGGGEVAAVKTGAVNVQFYIENSGSMHGFVRGGTQFKDVLEHLMVMANDHYHRTGVHFINQQVLNTGLGDDVSKFCLSLNPATIRVGQTTSSDINNIYAQILKRTDENTVSLLFSDCIYSVSGKNATGYLNHEKNLTQKAFMDALKRHGNDLSLVMLQCSSRFDGYYYDLNDEGHYYQGYRPYYVVIVGRTALVRDFCNKIKLDKDHVNGLVNKYMVSSQNVELDVTNSCVLTGDFTNARRIIPSRERLGIDRIEVEQQGRPLYFSVAVDANKLFTDESYLTDVKNYAASPEGLKVVKVDKVAHEGTAYGNCASAGLENPYYITLQSSNEAVGGKINVRLKYKLPEWVERTSTVDDTRRIGATTTFGISYMMRGINDAFLDKNPGKSIFNMNFLIENTGRSSSFPFGLVIVVLVIATVVGVSIKLKR